MAGLDVSLPPFAQARLQLNSTVFTPFSLNVSYAILNRTIQLTAPKPARKRTLLLLRSVRAVTAVQAAVGGS